MTWKRAYWILFALSFLLYFFPSRNLFSQSYVEFPVLYQARFRSADAYAQLWLADRYHAKGIHSTDLPAFLTTDSSALSLLWDLNSQGFSPIGQVLYFGFS